MRRMRWFNVGLILLCLLPGVATAQVTGSVESIGFDGYFRPDCWTPMVVTITAQSTQTDSYQIQVKAQDLDRDLAIYQRTISVTGASDSQSRLQHFRMYFMPPPTDGGLPSASDPGGLRDLQDRLKVSLHTSTGKWVCDLPITGTVQNIDPYETWPRNRGKKLIVTVTDGRSRPIFNDPLSTDTLGLLEDINAVAIHPADLPENVLGYDAIDAIVWLDADPSQLKNAGEERYRALESYVRAGGHLVVCQSMDWQKFADLSELLPVTVTGTDQKNTLDPLRSLAMRDAAPIGAEPDLERPPFTDLAPPFRFARAVAKPDSVVNSWIQWTNDADVSPYIARRHLGLGAVTWVAQDLGDQVLTRNKRGWSLVWKRVFDWKTDPIALTEATPDSVKAPYSNTSPLDLGRSLLGGMDLNSKSLGLVALAVLFFIVYWVVAGPGVYFYLKKIRRPGLNWFIYAACAFAATAVTAVLVKLVLRGPPELRHFSIVRSAPDQPTTVISRFGLYIPRDGLQRIELKDAAPNFVTSISALPISPSLLHDVPEETGSEYFVPIIEPNSESPASVAVKYRSTIKKFEANWVGQLDQTIHGSARLRRQNWIDGLITNGTPYTLTNVFIAFNYPTSGGRSDDWILYEPTWSAGVTIDLNKEFNNTTDTAGRPQLGFSYDDGPSGKRAVRGRMRLDYGPWLMADLHGDPGNPTYDDSSRSLRKTLIAMSLYDRIEPDKSDPKGGHQRVDLLRRGGRSLDLSQALAAGALVVLADADAPLPMPLDVEGERIHGNGRIFYQAVLPLDRTDVASTTQPSSD